nr:hypothetical protein [uncultured Flavobacterium sp.]
MNKIFYSILIFGAIMQEVAAQKIEENNFNLSEGVTYTVKRFYNSRTSPYGDAGAVQTHYYAKDHRFKTAWIEFSNNTDKDIEIDFEKIFLIGADNKRYHIHQVAQGMQITTTTEDYKKILKPRKTKVFMAKFWPIFPKDEKIQEMEVYGQSISLKEAE